MKSLHPTILVVDDDMNDLIFIEKAFRAIGVTDPIHAIDGGREALAYLRGEGRFADRELYAYPTFIMTDLKMPDTDGFGVLKFLQDHPERAVTPTVVLTGSNNLDDVKKAYRLGATSYHVKPVSPEKLRQLVKVLYEYWMTSEVPTFDRTAPPSLVIGNGEAAETLLLATE
jgi:CheY-like chemotaxis protein